jgi:hypothetical protein
MAPARVRNCIANRAHPYASSAETSHFPGWCGEQRQLHPKDAQTARPGPPVAVARGTTRPAPGLPRSDLGGGGVQLGPEPRRVAFRSVQPGPQLGRPILRRGAPHARNLAILPSLSLSRRASQKSGPRRML